MFGFCVCFMSWFPVFCIFASFPVDVPVFGVVAGDQA